MTSPSKAEVRLSSFVKQLATSPASSSSQSSSSEAKERRLISMDEWKALIGKEVGLHHRLPRSQLSGCWYVVYR
jgi:hypothetical protein